MSRACPKPDEEVCSIKKPVARNPRKNRWIDHINKEAKRLKISYMSAVGDKRVKESYAQNKFKSMTLQTKKTKAKGLIKADRKKGLGKKGDLDRELELLEELDQPLVRKAPKVRTPPISPEIINAPFSPAFSSPQFIVSPQVKTPKSNSTKKALKQLIADSPLNTPQSKSNSTKKALKQLIADSPITPGSAMQLSTPGSAFIRTSTPTLKQLLKSPISTPGSAMQLSTPGSAFIRTSTPTLKKLLKSPVASPYQPPKSSLSRFKRNQEKAKRQMEKLNL
jgi:hypothetical protein